MRRANEYGEMCGRRKHVFPSAASLYINIALSFIMGWFILLLYLLRVQCTENHREEFMAAVENKDEDIKLDEKDKRIKRLE